MRKVATEVIRRVYEDGGDGAFIEVGPDADGLGLIQICTTDKDSKDFYGAISLTVPSETALALAKAILACVSDADGK